MLCFFQHFLLWIALIESHRVNAHLQLKRIKHVPGLQFFLWKNPLPVPPDSFMVQTKAPKCTRIESFALKAYCGSKLKHACRCMLCHHYFLLWQELTHSMERKHGRKLEKSEIKLRKVKSSTLLHMACPKHWIYAICSMESLRDL